jgi:hypothetical protein
MALADDPKVSRWLERKRRRFARIEHRAPDLAEAVLRGAMSFRRAEFLALERTRPAEKEKEEAS